MSLVLPQKVTQKWATTSRQHYIDLGYEFTKIGDEFLVDVNDLSKGSATKVNVECDFCNCIKEMPWKSYLKLRGEKYCCPNCLTHKKKTRDKNGNLVFVEIPYRNKLWLQEEYVIKGRNATEIAKECGINVRTLREWIGTFNLTNLKGLDLENKISKDELYEMYCVKHMTSEEIGILYDTTGNTIISLVRKYGIKVPTRRELLQVYYNKKGGREKFREYGQRLENRIFSSCVNRGISIEEFDGFSSDDETLKRKNSEYREWRNKVFERDGYTCQCCSKHGGNLNAHHIKNFKSYPELRYEISNGITLCEKCHLLGYEDSFHTLYGETNNTEEQLIEFIKNKKLKLGVA